MTPDLPRCALCNRPTAAVHLTKHHLTPRSRGGRETALLCRTCHGQIHLMFENKQLAADLDTLDKLRTAPQLATYLAWIRRQPPSRQFHATTSPRRRRK